MLRIGIKDIAEEAGVSPTTVSHVINKTRYVSPEITERVNAAIKKLNYIPNIMARNLRISETKTVAVIVQQTSSLFFSKVIDEIADILYPNGYSVFLCTTKSKVAEEINVFKSMIQQQVCGVILSPQQKNFNYRTLCPKENFPMVFIDRKTEHIQGDTITCDNYNISYEAVRTLISKGHKKIGYLFSNPNLFLSTNSDRLRGYKNALKDCGLELDEALVIGMPEQSFSSGYHAMLQLLNDGEATACFAAENPMAQGAFKCLVDHKTAIPDKMALICFDDFEWAELTNPPITTIRQSMGLMGRRAAELLLDKIKAPDGAYKDIVLDSEIIMRRSC